VCARSHTRTSTAAVGCCLRGEMKGPFVTGRSALLTSRCVSRVRARLSHSLSVRSQSNTLSQQSKCAMAEQAAVLLSQVQRSRARRPGIQESYFTSELKKFSLLIAEYFKVAEFFFPPRVTSALHIIMGRGSTPTTVSGDPRCSNIKVGPFNKTRLLCTCLLGELMICYSISAVWHSRKSVFGCAFICFPCLALNPTQN